MTTLLETSQISPPRDASPDLSLPLTYFDVLWPNFHPIRQLLFYEFPCSKEYFLETLIPKLKKSLSLTLKHYTPLAGNLLYPLPSTPEKPKFRYLSGDSIPLIIAESTHDFETLVSNNPRDADQFYDFVPPLPPITQEKDYKILPFIALQVTLFPGSGICIGFSNNHTIGDANSMFGFINAWASINRLQGDEEWLTRVENYPNFDKNNIKDPLDNITTFWDVLKEFPLKPSSFPLPTQRVRATYTLNQTHHIKKLKDLVLSQKPTLTHISSFAVTAAYVWTSFLKSGDKIGEVVDPNVDEYFAFAADIRARMETPVPSNYFGNCLGYGTAKLPRHVLIGDQGFVSAAFAIAEDIRTRVNKRGELSKAVAEWFKERKKFVGVRRSMGVSGSPKFDLYGIDFGWGNARKVEVVSIDGENYTMSLCKSRDSEGGLEVGLSLPTERMVAFATIFEQGLRF